VEGPDLPLQRQLGQHSDLARRFHFGQSRPGKKSIPVHLPGLDNQRLFPLVAGRLRFAKAVDLKTTPFPPPPFRSFHESGSATGRIKGVDSICAADATITYRAEEG